MESLADTISVLVQDEPERQADLLLARVIAQVGARGGAVLEFSADDLRVFVGRGTSVSGLEVARVMWSAREEQPEPPPVIREGEHTLLPLTRGLRPVLGLVYLEGGTVKRQPLEHHLYALAAAIAASHGRRPELETPAPLRGEDHKAFLLRVLTDLEFNIAFAARRLGRSRRTVYLWMEKYGIKRPERLRPQDEPVV